jgi:hypothetical protein
MRMASLGTSDMDNGPEQLTDETVKATIRRQAQRVQVKSLVTAAAVTAIALILPV